MAHPQGTEALRAIQSELEAQTTGHLHKLSEKDCHELSHLCAPIFEDEA
jgi:hypothetical protein